MLLYLFLHPSLSLSFHLCSMITKTKSTVWFLKKHEGKQLVQFWTVIPFQHIMLFLVDIKMARLFTEHVS